MSAAFSAGALDPQGVAQHLSPACRAALRLQVQPQVTSTNLLLRRQALEDQDRLDARALLERVASSLAEADVELGEGRTAWDLSLDTLPYRTESAADYADWKAELTLKYQTNR